MCALLPHVKYVWLLLTATRAPSQYPIRCLSVRSRKVSKPRDLYLELSDRSEIWQALRQHGCRCACQISKRCNNSKYQSRDFDTSRDLAKKTSFRILRRGPGRVRLMSLSIPGIWDLDSQPKECLLASQLRVKHTHKLTSKIDVSCRQTLVIPYAWSRQKSLQSTTSLFFLHICLFINCHIRFVVCLDHYYIDTSIRNWWESGDTYSQSRYSFFNIIDCRFTEF